MNLFDEFFRIAKALERGGIRYAVIGGLAMAFHDEPRFTRDIDLLVHPKDARKIRGCMKKLGYFESTTPRTFADTQLTVRRFMKTEGEDYLVVDLLTSSQGRHRRIVERAADQPWQEGVVKVARKEDIIWLKEQRGSDQDRLDIGRLSDDKARASRAPGQ